MARSLKYIIGIVKVWFDMKSWSLTFLLAFGLTATLYNVAFSQDSLSLVWKHPRVGMCSARIGSKLYLIGGAVQIMQGQGAAFDLNRLAGTRMVDAFDFKNETWDTTVAPLNTPRVYATAVAFDDSIYVIGGIDDRGVPLNTMEVYDPTENSWHVAPSMLYRREGAASVVYGDSILVFGGGGLLGNLQRTVEAYSPLTGTWSVADTVWWGRAFHKAVKIGRYVYLFGGIGELGPYRFIERYDPENGSSQIGLVWDEPRAFFAIVVRDDLVFAISGYGSNSSDGFYGDVTLLDFHKLGAETQSKLGVLLDSSRAAFVADTGSDGKTYIFGGISPDYKGGQIPVPTVEVIQLFTGTDHVNVVKNNNTAPEDFSLSQNYPNPFNPATNIEFQVASPGSRVKLEIFNLLGQKVSTLVDRFMSGGKYSVVFEGENLPSGAYIYRLQSGNGIIYRKMVLVK